MTYIDTPHWSKWPKFRACRLLHPPPNIQHEDSNMSTNRSFNSTIDRMLTLNRALDEALASSWNGAPAHSRGWAPALDVIERQDAYLIAVEMPGVEPASVEVRFEQNVLTVRGTKPIGFDLPADTEVRVYSAERVSGDFERSVRLPEFVDSENIVAEARHGVLFLTVPKAQAARAKKIPIKGVESRQVGA
jgi:HSP20 family protein